MTDFFEPFAAGGPDHAMAVELAQGQNLARAASATATLTHYVWSTVCSSFQLPIKVTNSSAPKW